MVYKIVTNVLVSNVSAVAVICVAAMTICCWLYRFIFVLFFFFCIFMAKLRSSKVLLHFITIAAVAAAAGFLSVLTRSTLQSQKQSLRNIADWLPVQRNTNKKKWNCLQNITLLPFIVMHGYNFQIHNNNDNNNNITNHRTWQLSTFYPKTLTDILS